MYRRKLLQSTCGVGAISLAGCSGLLGGTNSTDEDEDETETESTDNGTETDDISESFEDGEFPSTLAVDSQANAPPVALTEAHSNSGGQSLRLASEPGTSSRVSVMTAQRQEDVSSVGIALRRLDAPTEESMLTYPTVDGELSESDRTGNIVTDGDEHAAILEIRHVDTSARVRVGINPYFGEVRLQSFSANSEDAVEVIPITTTPVTQGWHDLSLEIDDDTVVARIDDQSASASLPEALATGATVPRIAANAWGNGDEIAVAVDDFDVSQQ